LTKSSTI